MTTYRPAVFEMFGRLCILIHQQSRRHGTRISGSQKLDNFVMGQEIGETDINIIQSQ